MGQRHKEKITIRVTKETAYNLQKLMDMSNLPSPGRVVDKLVRDRMVSLKGATYVRGHENQ